MRKLASIQRILDIQPIVGADAIEVATINSWKVVVKKGEFQVGELVIYCEVDCWIPHAVAPFLSKGQWPRVYDGIEGERLKTVKLRGQLSQGLILPIAFVNNGDTAAYSFSEGDDVSEELGIVKYEPPIAAQLAGISRGAFPSIIPKTDEERIQNLTSDWPTLREHEYEVSEKLEGSSMTMAFADGEFIVCSRNLNLRETEGNTLWGIARRYLVEEKLRQAGIVDYAIQGEVIGEGIQKNHYGIKGQDFYVFTIYDTVGGKYVGPKLRKEICKLIDLKHVPVLGIMDFRTPEGHMSIDDVLKFADGQSALNPKVKREGLVFKRADGQEHFKAVSNEYLLKHG